ncbi:pituitary homeobox 3, partial [Silurus asotus]
ILWVGGMEFNLLADAEARSPALSLSDAGTPQHDAACKGQDNSGQSPGTILLHNNILKHYN